MPNEDGRTALSQPKHTPAIPEVHILWITGGLSCDGDSVSITAASQPSIEDVMLGSIPGLPKVHLHNAVLADLAVTIDDDPGRDLGTDRMPGHRFFFAPEEVERVAGDA